MPRSLEAFFAFYVPSHFFLLEKQARGSSSLNIYQNIHFILDLISAFCIHILMHHLVSTLLESFPLSVLLSGLIAMGLLSWLRPKGRISFYHSKDNQLTLTKVSGTAAKEQTTFVDICRSATPDTCNLNPFLFNGHLQTFWTVLKHDNVPVYYKRKMFESDSPAFTGQYAIDFVVAPYDMPKDPELTDQARKYTQESGMPPRTSFFTQGEFADLPSDDTKPMLVVLHGLSGGSHEVYLRHILAPLVKDGAWEACVVNSRGCSQTKISTGVLYNARATWDVRQSVKWIRRKFPNRPLFGIGFSLGANILANVCFLVVAIQLFTDNLLVPGRRGRCLSIEGSRPLCKPMELGRQLFILAKYLGWQGGIQQDDGRQHEKAL